MTIPEMNPGAYFRLTASEFDDFFEATSYAERVGAESVNLPPDVARRMAVTLNAVRPPARPARESDSPMTFTHLTRALDVLGDERARFLDAAKTADYQPATVIGESVWRQASVCYTWPLMPEVKTRLCAAMGINPGEVLEIQLTVSREGDYFREHVDNGLPQTMRRRLSFVYYLGTYDSFTGGLLNFPDLGCVVEPLDDSLIVFPSGELHEITKVRRTTPSLLSRWPSPRIGEQGHCERLAEVIEIIEIRISELQPFDVIQDDWAEGRMVVSIEHVKSKRPLVSLIVAACRLRAEYLDEQVLLAPEFYDDDGFAFDGSTPVTVCRGDAMATSEVIMERGLFDALKEKFGHG